MFAAAGCRQNTWLRGAEEHRGGRASKSREHRLVQRIRASVAVEEALVLQCVRMAVDVLLSSGATCEEASCRETSSTAAPHPAGNVTAPPSHQLLISSSRGSPVHVVGPVRHS